MGLFRKTLQEEREGRLISFNFSGADSRFPLYLFLFSEKKRKRMPLQSGLLALFYYFIYDPK
ncbi:hypothetical protein CBW16_12810 [Flavobacteriaceae bacterium JJC]|nr:hypothetical protein CBW16_12810 [Flavobacteriaceae bacterium JJC]